MPIKVIRIKGYGQLAGLAPGLSDGIGLSPKTGQTGPAYYKDVAHLASDVYDTSEIDEKIVRIDADVGDCGKSIEESLKKIQKGLRDMKKDIMKDKAFRESMRQEILADEQFRSSLLDELMSKIENISPRS